MTRIRDFGVRPGYLPTGRHNAITDVPDVRVGHTTLIEGAAIRTGVTAVLPHPGNLHAQQVPAAVHTINGYGKAHGFEQVRELGALETPILLTNTLNVGRVSDALTGYLLQENPDLMSVNPLVAECNDSFLNDIRGRHVGGAHVLAALEGAASGPVQEGSVGAGTGTACYQFKGGIGTASRRVDVGEGYMVGVLLQTNFGARRELRVMGVPVGAHLRSLHLPVHNQPGRGGSVIAVIATDAPMTSRQLSRLARRTAFGLGRTGTVCHHGSGDFAIAFTTANRRINDALAAVEPVGRLADRDDIMDRFFTAVVESVEEATYNALVAARTLTGRGGNTLHALPHDALSELLERHGYPRPGADT